MTVTITQIITYPIKSCAGIKHQRSQIDAMGLKGDRQMMLVDENGLFLSQRKQPKMALIQPQYCKQGLTVNAPGMASLIIDLHTNTAQPIDVTIWQDSLQAEPLQLAANQWFSNYLNKPVRLVKYGQQSHRLINPAHAMKGETVAFADGYPLLIAHQASLKQLNENLSHPVAMSRFRPNLVLNSELAAWDELNWPGLSAHNLAIKLVKPCIRCIITGVEQATGIQTGSEVLKTLKQKFAHQDQAVFGMNGMLSQAVDPITELYIGQKLHLQYDQNDANDQR